MILANSLGYLCLSGFTVRVHGYVLCLVGVGIRRVVDADAPAARIRGAAPVASWNPSVEQ